MPTTVNGIGTHYYGKRNVSRRDAVCQSCKQYGTLASYYTRLWFVIVFIPVIPLGRKRIMDECPRCRRHFVADADKYEANKQLQVSGSMDEYRRSPSPENALLAHASLMGFREFEEADAFRRAAIEQFPEHAGLHAGLGEQLEQFSNFHGATPLFERALEIDPDLPAARVGVARRMMAQGDLDGARTLLDFLEVPGAGQQHPLGPIDVLSSYYQNAGRHAEALEIAAHLLREIPAAGQQHTFRAFVKKSEKALGAAASILPPVEGSVRGLFKGADSPHPAWVRRVFWAGLVGGLLLAGLLASNEYIRRNRTLYVVDAIGAPIRVSIDGGPPATVDGLGKLTTREGRHRVEITGPIRETVELDMTSGFLDRWFKKPAWVVNAGGAAVLDEATVYYASDPRPSDHRLVAGKPVLVIPHVDHPFEAPPQSVEVGSRSAVATRQVLTWLRDPASQLFATLLARGDRADAMSYAEAQLRAHPEDHELLQEYVQQAAAGEVARVDAFLESGLDRRPVDVFWHRAYQAAAEASGRGKELIARYDAALAADPEDAGLIYLRGRIDPDIARREAHFRRALKADPKFPWSWFALGMQAVSEGRWDEGLDGIRKARELGIPEDTFRDAFHVARLGRGEAKALVAEYRSALAAEPMNFAILSRLFDALAASGEADRIGPELQAWIARLPAQAVSQAGLVPTVRALAEYQAGHPEKALEAAGRSPEVAASPIGLQASLAAGKGREAASNPSFQRLWQNPWLAMAACVELGLEGAGKEAAEMRGRALKAMGSLGTLQENEARILDATAPPAIADVLRNSTDVDNKALLLCDLATRFPAKRAEYLGAAARFNVLRRPPYLLVKRAVERGGVAERP
ncbi:hypothetical protein OJF2_12500 [Aquisphaera giovannonii]|uniref:Tetratricopeptide repeat protein n=1 Tax=Aquisphaera giovannonii TaxID=406548 RepID=A0A5B9VXC9_9BACT|nr:tetratricopeptide repeat protein [Aquisphaera giovannonii]QEH32769.1 hypothetical protein OJF2_12500 [Aquisphaera giovannonii]